MSLLHESYEGTSKFIFNFLHPHYETTYSMSPITSLPLLRNSEQHFNFFLPTRNITCRVALLGRTLDTNTCKEHNKRLVKFTYYPICLRPKWN